jgi:hypothetical protein
MPKPFPRAFSKFRLFSPSFSTNPLTVFVGFQGGAILKTEM